MRYAAAMKSGLFTRPLVSALVFSLLLHLALVFGPGWPQPERPAMPAGAMRVVVGARATVAPSRAAVSVPNVPPEKPGIARAAVPPPVLAMPPQAAPEKSVAAAGAPAKPDISPAAAAPAEQGVPVAVATAPVAAGKGPAADTVSADALRQYRIDLAASARRFRHYPAAARLRGEEGVVELEVLVVRGIALPSVRLAKGSGHVLLDEQARTMVEQAVRATTMPEAMRGRDALVPMPIRFSLDSD